MRTRTIGAYTGYHTKAFVPKLRDRGIRAHVARIEGRRKPGLDACASRHASYRANQRTCKRIEKIFGWLKTVGGSRKSRFSGLTRTRLYAHFAAGAKGLPTIATLAPVPSGRTRTTHLRHHARSRIYKVWSTPNHANCLELLLSVDHRPFCIALLECPVVNGKQYRHGFCPFSTVG